MKIVIIQLGTTCECLLTSSLIKGLRKQDKDVSIYILTSEKSDNKVFKFNPNVKQVTKSLPSIVNSGPFDRLINLSPSFMKLYGFRFVTKMSGFNLSYNCEKYQEILYGDEKTDSNLFQIYFKLAGMKWRGEGYELCYYPKTKTNKKKTGIALVNTNLKNYILEKLQLESSRLWNIPLRKNLYKRIDEINKCQNIVTDDFLTMHISIALKKYVYFLETIPCNTKIEFFKRGEIIKVPSNILRWI